MYRALPLCLLLAATVLTAQAQEEPERGLRGVYLTNVDSDVLNNRASIAEAMEYLASRGFNTVMPVVWNKAYTLFPSEVMAQTFGESYRQDPFFAQSGRDPLQEVIVEAHRVGMEVIPWFEYGFAASYASNGGHIVAAKPGWAAIDKDGRLVTKNGFEWLNALDPEVQAFMLDLIREVAERYDVDGIQGDDRLPALPVEAGYSEVTKALYRAEHGGADPPANPRDTAFKLWKAAKITTFAGELYRMVKTVDPNLIVAHAPSHYPWGRDEYLQDTNAWLDSNYVDLVSPQLYRYDVSSYKSVFDQTRGYVEPWHRSKLFPAILVKAGSRFNDPAYVKEAIAYNRQYGITGEAFFFYEGLREKNDHLADTLYQYFYDTPAILPGREGLWRPEAEIVNEDPTGAADWAEATGTSGYEATALQATAAGATLAYAIEVPYDATYDVYAYAPAGTSGATTSARYTLRAPGGDQTTTVNQKAQRGWVRIGQAAYQQGATVEVELEAGADGTTYADAVMLLLNRKQTPDLVIPTAVEGRAGPGALPERAVLHGNYPNPFNPQTTIRFTLGQAAPVDLRVFDLMGREVAVLLRGAAYAPGTHEVGAELGALPSGVYLYQLTTPTTSAQGRMVLLK